jgi:hypothetical protein
MLSRPGKVSISENIFECFPLFVLQGFLHLISIIHQAVFATIMPVFLVDIFPISTCPIENLSDFFNFYNISPDSSINLCKCLKNCRPICFVTNSVKAVSMI